LSAVVGVRVPISDKAHVVGLDDSVEGAERLGIFFDHDGRFFECLGIDFVGRDHSTRSHRPASAGVRQIADATGAIDRDRIPVSLGAVDRRRARGEEGGKDSESSEGKRSINHEAT
jgi:hypothetical protein